MFTEDTTRRAAVSRLYRTVSYLFAATACWVVLLGQAAAGPVLFRIGTGGTDGTYFPIGMLIAESISGRRPAGLELLGVAQLSNGSVANGRDLHAGRLEAGLMQADVAYWAYHGQTPFAAGDRLKLRALATLYPETIHLVARHGAGIDRPADLHGRRVSLDEPGSGTLVDATLILRGFGLSPADLQAVYLKPEDAAERLLAGRLDAFFIIAGHPLALVTRLISQNKARLIPIAGPQLDRLIENQPFFSRTVIPTDSYPGQPAVSTLAVGAQLMVRADLDEELVYQVTTRLWSTATQRRLSAGHPKGRSIRPDLALYGLSVPLHPGAVRFYRNAGLLPHRAQRLPALAAP